MASKFKSVVGSLLFLAQCGILNAQINTNRHLIDNGFEEGYWIQAVDFDKDGDTDIVGASHNSGLKWYRNDGSGFFSRRDINNSFKDAWSVHAIDMDSDYDLDVVAVSSDENTLTSRLSWFEQESGGFSEHEITTPSGMLGHSVFAADIDGDGDNDILVAAWGLDQALWWEHTSGHNFVQRTLDDNFSSGHAISAADLNNNGRIDVVGIGGGKTVIWRNDGGAQFTRKNLGTSGGGFGVAIRDFNKDGLLDILRAERDGDIDWFRSKDGVSFTDENIIAAGMGESWSVDMGDFDHDGDNDVVAAGYVFSPNKISLFINGGNDSFSEQVLDEFERPRAVAVADFDGDGDDDIAAVITRSDEVFWYEVISTINTNTITVVAPNGGETLAKSTDYNIVWTSTGSISNVKIEYSIDNGENWSTAIASIENTGTYTWSVPDVEISQARVRISQADDAGVSDISDDSFSIGSATIALTTPNGGQTLSPGTLQDISWMSEGISSVTIEYSIDRGDSWILIQSGIPDTGSTSWVVPNIYSQKAMIRVSNGSGGYPADESDTPFTIAGNGFNIMSPSGSEVLSAGSVYKIKWERYGTVAAVNIEYSTDAGTHWQAIASNVSNTGSYDWQVPQVSTNNALVRVIDTSNSSVMDRTEDSFTISVNSITVTSPNGGETWIANNFHLIEWTSTGTVPTVSIAYSVDGGNTWETIVATTANSGSSVWLIPPLETENALIKVSNSQGGEPSDISNGQFSIQSLESEITLMAPNGGEVWTAGTTQMIEWQAVDAFFNIKLQFNAGLGDGWQTIVESTPNTGSFFWFVPNTPTGKGHIRIMEATDSSPVDYGDHTFRIIAGLSLKLTSPNGGEIWNVGQAYELTWESTGEISFVTLSYSPDDGETWLTIAADVPNSGSYHWTVPSVQSGSCLVRVKDSESSGISDISDAVFSIGEGFDLTIASPNGGEHWIAGTTHDIKWSASEDFDALKIEYSADAGNTWQLITANTPNDGLFGWVVPNIQTSQAKIRLSDPDDATRFDVSNSMFEIGPATELLVISPNGGESWPAGTIQQIKWSTPVSVAAVNLEVSTDNGFSWQILASSLSGTNIWNWQLPMEASNQALVRISDANDTHHYDLSDASFSIDNNLITITAPNGGEVWTGSSTKIITWAAAANIAAVDIEYATSEGGSWVSIESNYPNSGNYSWVVPDINTEQARVRVTSDNDASISDISDGPFQVKASSISLSRPTEGEILTGDRVFEVAWNATGLVLGVKIEYAIGGENWVTVVADAPNTGKYAWKVPGVTSAYVLMRISDSNDGSPMAESGPFKITQNASSVTDLRGLPENFALHQNYPNPFNLATRIDFETPEATNASLVIFNIQGELIREIQLGRIEAGLHSVSWDGHDLTGKIAPSGIYIYRIRLGIWLAARKLMLLK